MDGNYGKKKTIESLVPGIFSTHGKGIGINLKDTTQESKR